eukprot:3673365-Amphidinium_carterae.1
MPKCHAAACESLLLIAHVMCRMLITSVMVLSLVLLTAVALPFLKNADLMPNAGSTKAALRT